MPTVNLVRRARAVERTMQRFAARPFRLGSVDCVKLARFHLTGLGHKLPSTGHYRSAIEAARQLKRQGARNIAELLDQHLARIAPAAMLPGDLAMPPSEPDAPAWALGTIVVMASRHKFLGFHPDHDCLALIELSQLDAAWRA